ncbi:hypothetical protein AB1Y20_006918 [Prymnesium parvum]|uniref:SnoaL-like domain-containing protein n=1 Tax=Prymnesium parvum TaxID=97485 RepID=A0AB34IZQ2_PRYPA
MMLRRAATLRPLASALPRAVAAPLCTAHTPSQRLLQLARDADLQIYGGAAATAPAAAAFVAWHDAISAGTRGDASAIERLRPHVHERCIFRPPTYFTPWEGGDELVLLLSCVGEVFGSSFAYGRQWLSEDGRQWALEFRADVAGSGKAIDGIDLVALDADGKIVDFTVLARPPNAVEELKRQMLRRVPVKMAALKAKQALGFA